MSPTEEPPDEPTEHERTLADRLRVPGFGVQDPNLIGDAGPLDVAPGADPPELPTLAEELPPEVETPSERLLPSDEADQID